MSTTTIATRQTGVSPWKAPLVALAIVASLGAGAVIGRASVSDPRPAQPRAEAVDSLERLAAARAFRGELAERGCHVKTGC